VLDAGASELLELSLDQLMDVEVTSVSKKSQTLGETAAAVYVIRAEDIRRSGATSIPEALRLAPGVQVSAVGHNKWAVSIRGFADRFSNKLLVLVDGRSVYTPLFSGVLWEALDVPLESIDRIEVIRGPGASIWGANAVNGVINIITKSAFDTEGKRLSLAAGNELRGYGYARYGWKPDVDTAVRLYAKAHDYDASRPVSGGDGVDDWRNQSIGFNVEHLKDTGTLQLQGSAYRSRAGDEISMVAAPPSVTEVRDTQELSGGYLLGRWEEQRGPGRWDSLRVSLDYSDYKHDAILSERRSTVDAEYQQRRSLGDLQDLIWGIGYRWSCDSVDGSPMVTIADRTSCASLYSAYVQDDIVLRPDRVVLSLGARLENNEYTGTELQPNVRLLWSVDDKTSAWLSLARATRTPSRVERGAAIYFQADPEGIPPFVPPSLVQLVNSDLRDERLKAVDIGWRRQISANTALDLAGFYYRYSDLRGAALSIPKRVPPGYLLIPTAENNSNSAHSYGVEVALDWRPIPEWRLQGNYAGLHLNVHTASLPGQTPSEYEGTSPNHQFSLRSSADLPRNLRWDVWLRHVSRIDAYDIPAYTTLDMRLAWKASKDLELALVGQNLLDDSHPEFGSLFIRSTPSEIERGFYATVDWKF